jgi:hypothetical protein
MGRKLGWDEAKSIWEVLIENPVEVNVPCRHNSINLNDFAMQLEDLDKGFKFFAELGLFDTKIHATLFSEKFLNLNQVNLTQSGTGTLYYYYFQEFFS